MDCSTPFYVKDLSICGFWCPWGSRTISAWLQRDDCIYFLNIFSPRIEIISFLWYTHLVVRLIKIVKINKIKYT